MIDFKNPDNDWGFLVFMKNVLCFDNIVYFSPINQFKKVKQMSDSKKLPIIEVGDTVVFKKDLEVFTRYGSYLFVPEMARYANTNQIVRQSHSDGFYIEDDALWYYSPEMVAEVIKPTKERVYSEEEMREAIELAREVGMKGYSYTAQEIIESLNK